MPQNTEQMQKVEAELKELSDKMSPVERKIFLLRYHAHQTDPNFGIKIINQMIRSQGAEEVAKLSTDEIQKAIKEWDSPIYFGLRTAEEARMEKDKMKL